MPRRVAVWVQTFMYEFAWRTRVGLYEWDGAELAEAYALALWRVLALVSERGSIHYHVLPGLHRDDLTADPGVISPADPGVISSPVARAEWWRPVRV